MITTVPIGDRATQRFQLPMLSFIQERIRKQRPTRQLELPDQDLQSVIRLIHHYDGISYTRDRAGALVTSAKSHLSGFPDCPAKEAMLRLADYIVSRKH